MLSFFRSEHDGRGEVYAVRHRDGFSAEDIEALEWLFSGAELVETNRLQGSYYVGPRAEMVTPWSTTATEITYNMGLGHRVGIDRIEFYQEVAEDTPYDRMLLRKYHGLSDEIFEVNREREGIIKIQDLRSYDEQEGLALSDEEIEYLEGVARELGRPLTDSEVFGFSQVNSEHCRHKIFNGTFVIDGEEQAESLFGMIKKTSKEHPNRLISAYKDNVAFVHGPKARMFAPKSATSSDFFNIKEVETALSLKAETHNFPTTVEPFNGAATGTGGEIRDRLAGGKASTPLAGTAIYMTPYTREESDKPWEGAISARPWLYQTPQELLTKASNGASDFGNKFGQPLITGSVLTFEHQEDARTWGYDKVIMLAGGIGYTTTRDATKGGATPGDKIVVMGGDNYRIGMGGGAVSSVNTGQFEGAIELNAIQRSNPEMQKRVANVIRALAESDINPVVSIHDHGAGGHLNCLSELVEETGGHIDLDALPVGDPTLSDKEIISNESQERMGLLLKPNDVEAVRRIAKREMAPFYVVGEATDDGMLIFKDRENEEAPFDLKLEHLFGSAPKTVMEGDTVDFHFAAPTDQEVAELTFEQHLKNVLRLEAVGSKDWLTNKVDRSVSGRVARQQCVGPLQVPLADLGAVALDYEGNVGIATSVGHAPQPALVSEEAGSRLAIAEALTNLIGAPLTYGMEGISLSANWMWPCRNEGENARLYRAVKACSDFAIALGINVPTGKDSLSMTQKYPDGEKVLSPGTLIISALGEVSDVKKIVTPVLKDDLNSSVLYIDLSSTSLQLGGSAYYQTMEKVGNTVPDVADADYFKKAYEAIQTLVREEKVLALHDVSAGGIITALLEMLFAQSELGLEVTFDEEEQLLFAENPALLLQVSEGEKIMEWLEELGISFVEIAKPIREYAVKGLSEELDVAALREAWTSPSNVMEQFQSAPKTAKARKTNRYQQPVEYKVKEQVRKRPIRENERSKVTAAIIRDKGTNGEREMAYALYLAGFDVKDVHMSDLINGRETLADVQMLVFCGGFSHSDVLGSAKGWAAGFKYNELARKALDNFYKREDTLSLGICNGCQLMAELGLLSPEERSRTPMKHNTSGKFESSFVSLEIPENNSVFLSSLAGETLGCWVAHGEGRFDQALLDQGLPVAARYLYEEYPGNPNGSPMAVAAVSSKDGRHLAMMPHPERCIFPWQCGYYPEELKQDEVTPWLELFSNAFEWCSNN
ncbi:MAG: phosphoribosylformylglycinamidine synthase [Porphyromonas sp.]|nr:phosphoribosylformylglycinamidine synthase [Porphyromonas sp.]